MDKSNKWEGISRSSIQLLNNVFDKPSDISLCPVCGEYTERTDGCMYLSHTCTNAITTHKKLYKKYKSPEGKIYWCTICGRICHGHSHYPLVSSTDPKPALLPQVADQFFNNRDDIDRACLQSGGGGFDEKLKRLVRYRQYIWFAQEEFIGIEDRKKVWNNLIELTWDAPLFSYQNNKVREIRNTGIWNISNDRFTEASPISTIENRPNNVPEYPFERTGNKLPTLGGHGMCNISFNDCEERVQFHHRQKNGSMNHHESCKISKEEVENHIAGVIGDRSKLGSCPCGGCNGTLHPDELIGIIEANILTRYRDLYNRKMAEMGGGRRMLGGYEEIMKKAKNIQCSISGGKTRKRKNNRK